MAQKESLKNETLCNFEHFYKLLSGVCQCSALDAIFIAFIHEPFSFYVFKMVDVLFFGELIHKDP